MRIYFFITIICVLPLIVCCQTEVQYKNPPYNRAEELLRAMPSIVPSDKSNFFIDEHWPMMDSMSYLHIKNIKHLLIVKVDSIPEWIGEMKSLEEFYYTSFKKKKFPKQILKLKNLRQLSLNDLEDSIIPSEICELKKLEFLVLSGYNITSIPECIGSLKNLKKLVIRANITLFPSSFSNLHKLESINIEGPFAHWPDFMKESKDLSIIAIRHSPIQEIPNWLANLKQLKELDLYGSSVSKLPDNIGDLPNLEKLDISNTYITELPASIYNLKKLKWIETSGTNVQISDRLFEMMKENYFRDEKKK